MQKTRTYAFRVPMAFADIINRFLAKHGFTSPSELARYAIREKIQKDDPELYTAFINGTMESKGGIHG